MKNNAKVFINKSWRKLKELPEPGREWTLVGHDRWIIARSDKIEEFGIIEKVDKRFIDDTSHPRNVYKTDTEAWEMIQKYKEVDKNSEGVLPCGHDSFRNPRGTDDIECKICDEKFERAKL